MPLLGFVLDDIAMERGRIHTQSNIHPTAVAVLVMLQAEPWVCDTGVRQQYPG